MDFLVVCGGTGGGLIGNTPHLDGELLIDVSEENEEIVRCLSSLPDNFYRIDLDQIRIPQTGNAIFWYLQNTEVEHEDHYPDPAARNLIKDLHKQQYGFHSFMYGYHQQPTLAAAIIRHPNSVFLLDAAIARMYGNAGGIGGVKAGVDIWIVSSTAGATGEGIHRFVAERFISFFEGTRDFYRIHFLRLGNKTYESCDTAKNSLNAFVGVALDNAFHASVQEKFRTKTDSLRRTLDFNYFELPDVGSGYRAKPIRKKMVAKACNAIMMRKFRKDFTAISSNMAVVSRVGFWGGDFTSSEKYSEMMHFLKKEFSGLQNAQIKELDEGAPEPFFDLKVLSSDSIYSFTPQRIIDVKWKFPAITKESEDLESLESDVRNVMNSFGLFFNDDVFWYKNIEPKNRPALVIVTNASEDNRNQKPNMFGSHPSLGAGNSRYRTIRQAIIVKGWAERRLGLNTNDKMLADAGLLHEVYDLSNKILDTQKAFFKSKETKAQEISEWINDLFVKAVEASLWIAELRKSNNVLEKGLKLVESLLKRIDESYSAGDVSYYEDDLLELMPASLNKRFEEPGSPTWFDLLVEAVEQEAGKDNDPFREAVIRGVNGLTDKGLRRLLHAGKDVPLNALKAELCDDLGCYLPELEEKEISVWWQGSKTPPIGNSISYRIFPDIEKQLRIKMGKGADGIAFAFTDIESTGLNIYSIEAAKLAGEYEDAYAFLISEFVPHMRDALKEWKFSSMEPTGRYHVMMKINLDEPMDRAFLSYIGLNEEEIEKLGYYCKLI